MPLAAWLFASAADAESLREPKLDSALHEVLRRVYAMEYAPAESLAAALPRSAPARPYFSGLVCINRFADRGDTAALRRAEDFWGALWFEDEKRATAFAPSPEAPLELYRGLAGLQLSYAATLRGSRLKAARLAWKARGKLIPLSRFAEAEAALALFDYYRSLFLEHLSFLPFVNPDADAPLRRLQAAADSSRYLRDLLRGSEFWIRFDRDEIDGALGIVDGFLQRHPDNRLARQMRGDAMLRGQKPEEARRIYESLLAEYARLPSQAPAMPLGYYCAVGNLARIYSALGLQAETKAKLEEWKKAEKMGLDPWLPPSLKKEVGRLPER